MSRCRQPIFRRRAMRPWLMFAWLMPVLSSVWCPGRVHAEDALTVTTNYYLVSGSNLREIRASINRARPDGKAGMDALTTWQIKWRSRVTSANGQCRLTSLSATTTVTITLPSWKAPTNAPPELLKKWVTYYTALQRHEQNHVQSAKLAAEALRRRIEAIGPEADCVTLQQRIKATAENVIAEFRKRDTDYDRETDHGRTEGARL